MRAAIANTASVVTLAPTTSASSAVTVAQPNDVASVELNPGGANVLRGHVGAHARAIIQ